MLPGQLPAPESFSLFPKGWWIVRLDKGPRFDGRTRWGGYTQPRWLNSVEASAWAASPQIATQWPSSEPLKWLGAKWGPEPAWIPPRISGSSDRYVVSQFRPPAGWSRIYETSYFQLADAVAWATAKAVGSVARPVYVFKLPADPKKPAIAVSRYP